MRVSSPSLARRWIARASAPDSLPRVMKTSSCRVTARFATVGRQFVVYTLCYSIYSRLNAKHGSLGVVISLISMNSKFSVCCAPCSAPDQLFLERWGEAHSVHAERVSGGVHAGQD